MVPEDESRVSPSRRHNNRNRELKSYIVDYRYIAEGTESAARLLISKPMERVP